VFGFWVFLMSDFILFGLMFATYATMQNPMSYAGGPGPKDVFDLTSAFIQTMLLLTSTLTFWLPRLIPGCFKGSCVLMMQSHLIQGPQALCSQIWFHLLG
jgi:cytochrome o ubiquinol oxidase subunit 3